MKFLILPGFSPHNQLWAESIGAVLSPVGKVQNVDWEHWQAGSPSPHWVDRELEKIRPLVSNQPFSVVAKSIGTYVAAKLINSFPPIIVDKLVLCGIPVNDLTPKELDAYQTLDKISPDKILVLQNNQDPHGTDIQIVELFKKLNLNFVVESLKADNHEYLYPDQIKSFLTNNS